MGLGSPGCHKARGSVSLCEQSEPPCTLTCLPTLRPTTGTPHVQDSALPGPCLGSGVPSKRQALLLPAGRPRGSRPRETTPHSPQPHRPSRVAPHSFSPGPTSSREPVHQNPRSLTSGAVAVGGGGVLYLQPEPGPPPSLNRAHRNASRCFPPPEERQHSGWGWAHPHGARGGGGNTTRHPPTLSQKTKARHRKWQWEGQGCSAPAATRRPHLSLLASLGGLISVLLLWAQRAQPPSHPLQPRARPNTFLNPRPTPNP